MWDAVGSKKDSGNPLHYNKLLESTLCAFLQFNFIYVKVK